MCLRGRLRSVALNFCRSYSVLRPGYREKRRIVSAVEHEKHFELKWSDGSVSRCLYLWLRDNAPQRHTYEISDVCNARRMLLRDLRLDLRPTHTSAESDTLNVQWSDGAQCSYSSTWLGQHVLFDADLRKERRRVYMQREAVLWNRETFEKENYLKHWSWTALHEDDQVLHDFLTQFQQAGVVFVDSFPAQENELCAFVRRVAGFEFRTHYGSYFDVRSEANPTNVAYTSDALGFHTDLPYLQYPPQIQLLHCIAQSPSGGLSRYVDGFEVARQLRRDHPEVYKILCRAPLEYIDDGRDDIQFDLTNRWPVFNTDPLSGQLSHIQFSNQQRGWFYDCDDEERLFEIYRAMIRFNEYMESERNFIEFTMQPGSIGMFSNTRVLHARTPFAPPRLLQGTYISHDWINSRVRCLRDDLGAASERNQISV